MKIEYIQLISKDGVVDTYKNKEEAYKMLGYNFIYNNVGFEIREFKRTDYYSRMIASDARKSLNNKWIHNGKMRYGDAIRDIGEYAELNYYNLFLLVNDFNEKLCIIDFIECVRRERSISDERKYLAYNKKYWNGEGAVPGTGKKTFSRFYRRPKTLNILRQSCEIEFNDDEDIVIPFRASRTKWNIPTAWDDKPRSDIRIKNWKKHRKTQYKESL